MLGLVSCTHTSTQNAKVINNLLDDWHRAAAEGNLEAYFSLFHANGHFLGTDKTEDWDKKQFYKFCKPYFEDGKAWDFTSVSRNVYFSGDMQTVWFNEVLDTWMGPCRGSGVLIMTDDHWMMMQYNLAILVDNELIEDYLKLLDQGNE